LFAEKRRHRWVLAAVGLGVVALALAWTLANTTGTAHGAQPGPKVIRANQFILEDQNGMVSAILTVDKDGAGLILGNENGKAIWSAR
jgi:predicted lipoprotein with Yx(FWY)xxD motif